MGNPAVVVVMLHPGCRMACRFCATDPFSELSFEEASGVVLAARDAGARSVVLGGGEPFEWRHDVLKLAARAREAGLLVQVGTNGIPLPPDFARLDCIDRYVLPLESTDPAVHDGLRAWRASHHELMLDRLEELRAAGKSVTISTVVTRQTLSGLGDLARFLDSYRTAGGALHAWHLYRFLPVGRGGRPNAAALDVDEAGYLRACEAVKRLPLGFTVYRRDDMFRSRTVGFYPPPASRESPANADRDPGAAGGKSPVAHHPGGV